jgi:transposase
MRTNMLRIELNDTEIESLKRLGSTAPGRVSERAHFVLMSHQGDSAAKIGERMFKAENTVKHWLRQYQAAGIKGLEDCPRPGRYPKQPHLLDVVEAQIGQSPDCFGYLPSIWTLLLLLLHLKTRFAIEVSESTVRRALRTIGFSWHRPKLSPAKRPDPLDEQRRTGLSVALADPSCQIVAVDECDMSLLAVVRSMWQRIGEQLRLPTPGQNAKIGVFGAINLRTGELFARCCKHKRSLDFIQFLCQLADRYTSGTVRVILDNGSIHHSAQTRSWLSLNPRFQMVYLPTYSGHLLNPIEKVWWLLKQHIAANRNFRNIEVLQSLIEHWLAAQQPHLLLTLINSDVTRRSSRQALRSAGVNLF